MRSINWKNVQASSDGGGFTPLPAGNYVAKVVSMEDVPEKEYVRLVWDIAEGEHAGYYSDAWGQSHPYAHQIFLSYKDTAQGMLKGRLEAIQRSNPGFDPFAAWDAGRLDIFNNRIFGINLQEEEFEKNDGSIGTRWSINTQVFDADEAREDKRPVRPVKKLDGTSAARPVNGVGGGQVATADDVVVPFNE